MKISIENFGPIHSFDFDLDKDFHVIYGKNNIGKSYAISVVYLILKELMELRNGVDDIPRLVLDFRKNTDNSPHKEFVPAAIKYFFEQNLLLNLQKAFKNSFPDLRNLDNKFSGKKALIKLKFNAFLFISISIDNDGHFFILELVLNYHLNQDYDKEILAWKIYENGVHAIQEKISKTFFLPASRSGLYQGMNIFSSVFAMLSQNRHTIGGKIEIPSLPIPVSDYFLNISTIKQQASEDLYHGFAKEIEEKILDANIEFNHETKKLEYFSKKLGLRLDLSQTSSMVSEIAPVVAYLKYVINKSEDEGKSQVIFIEEPEAHLHPEVQLQLAEIFAKLSQNGIKIVMTTHSNYIFNKVNNMILKKELSLDKVANYHIINTPKGSIVDPHTKMTEAGIEDHNFVQTAEKLYHERLETLDNERPIQEFLLQ